MSHLPVFLTSMGVFMLVAGVAGGVAAFDAGEDPATIMTEVEDGMYHENGTLNVSEEPRRGPMADSVPDELTDPVVETPQADSWVRQHVVAPLIRGLLWVLGIGVHLGHGLASVVGVGVSKTVVYAGLAACVGAPAWRVYTMFREVAG